jgi:small membrane protein
MRLIQIILVGGFIVSLLLYLRFLRSSLRDRLTVLLLFTAMCVAVVHPDLTNEAAALVGVGRGTDLTLYLFLVAGVFFAVMAYSRISSLSRDLTEVVRRLAIVEHEAAKAASGEDRA